MVSLWALKLPSWWSNGYLSLSDSPVQGVPCFSSYHSWDSLQPSPPPWLRQRKLMRGLYNCINTERIWHSLIFCVNLPQVNIKIMGWCFKVDGKIVFGADTEMHLFPSQMFAAVLNVCVNVFSVYALCVLMSEGETDKLLCRQTKLVCVCARVQNVLGASIKFNDRMN